MIIKQFLNFWNRGFLLFVFVTILSSASINKTEVFGHCRSFYVLHCFESEYCDTFGILTLHSPNNYTFQKNTSAYEIKSRNAPVFLNDTIGNFEYLNFEEDGQYYESIDFLPQLKKESAWDIYRTVFSLHIDSNICFLNSLGPRHSRWNWKFSALQ